MSTYHIVKNFNIMCIDWVVAGCAGYSIKKKKALKNFFCGIVFFVYEIIITFTDSLWKHVLVYMVSVEGGCVCSIK